MSPHHVSLACPVFGVFVCFSAGVVAWPWCMLTVMSALVGFSGAQVRREGHPKKTHFVTRGYFARSHSTMHLCGTTFTAYLSVCNHTTRHNRQQAQKPTHGASVGAGQQQTGDTPETGHASTMHLYQRTCSAAHARWCGCQHTRRFQEALFRSDGGELAVQAHVPNTRSSQRARQSKR